MDANQMPESRGKGQREESGKPETSEHWRNDTRLEGRHQFFMDIDRMVNEGLGGGNVTDDNGLIEETTTDTMEHIETLYR